MRCFTLDPEGVVIVNFGGQYAHLISRRLRELGVYTEVISCNEVLHNSKWHVVKNSKAIILSGGPSSVYENPDDIEVARKILSLNKPVLGICYGHQLIAKAVGGHVTKGEGEYGRTTINIVDNDDLFLRWSRSEIVWMSHRDCVSKLPSKVKVLAISEKGYIAAFKLDSNPIYGVQFHPEVTHTVKGKVLLDNFLKIANVPRKWMVSSIVDDIIRYLKKEVEPNAKVLAAVSGGVDSTVAALLVKKVVGNRLIPVFVNHGLLRENEVNETLANLEKIGLKPLIIDAENVFLEKLKGTRDCEERRKIVGELFAKIFKEIAEKDPSIKYLVQGTTYPDIIESGCVVRADKIKSHHNVAGLPKWLSLRVIEPLKYLYKDEVRRIARYLGVPEEIIKKHPFPGPGFAVRIIGEFTFEKLSIVRKATRIVEEELRENGLYDKVWQAFAVVGDDKWVGVKGDSRDVGYIVTIRIVVSEDAMTADWFRIPYDVLDRIARRITSEIDNVSMVTYAVSCKPPSTIEPC